MKNRIDVELVERGLVESRAKARALIMAGEVLVNGHSANKASDAVRAEDQVELRTQERYVGRGGLKLERALEFFGISPLDKRCLDIGASTGGFTDCLLQKGACLVVALDVGHGQLHWRIRQDPRVRVREHCNARQMEPDDFDGTFDLVVMDVSFISQRLIWPRIAPLLQPTGVAISLVKPQFEAGAREVEKGGIVRDPAVQERVIMEIRTAVESLGLRVTGVCESPILGREGNKEFLLCAHPSPP